MIDAPLFTKSITIKEARIEWNGNRGMYLIEEAELTEKFYIGNGVKYKPFSYRRIYTKE